MSCYHETDQSVISSNPLTKLLLCQEKQLRKDGDMRSYHGVAKREKHKSKRKKKPLKCVYSNIDLYNTIPRLRRRKIPFDLF